MICSCSRGPMTNRNGLASVFAAGWTLTRSPSDRATMPQHSAGASRRACSIISSIRRGSIRIVREATNGLMPHGRTADISRMEVDARTLRQLIQGNMYAVDERAVADAIVIRARLLATIG